MAPFVYRITPYDPADLDAAADGDSTLIAYDSRERVAAACVAAVAGFALDDGVQQMTIDNPMTEGFFSFSVLVGRGGHGLSGLFPRDSVGFHDGARVPLATGLGLLRAMVLREGAWCRLRADNGFFVHVGDRDDIYVGGGRDQESAVSRTRLLGLFADRVASSPYDPALDGTDASRSADEEFWSEVRALVADRGGVLLEERPTGNAYRWHRLTTAHEVEAVRERLTPRARLAVWPDLTDDVEGIRAAVVRGERLHLLVQQHPGGGFHKECVAEPGGRADVPHPRITEGPGHRHALVPLERADRHPLLAAVLPDEDGVLRARWRTNRSRAEERRTFLGSLRVGEAVTGVVASGLHDVGVYVHLDDDLGRFLGFLRVPEMSWTRFDSVDDIAPIGRVIRAEIIGIDFAREQVSLSMKALQPDPWQHHADTCKAGDTVSGTVTELVPLGAFVRIREGVEGLVHLTELADRHVGSPQEVVAVGDQVRVVVLDVDRRRRRISLSLRRAQRG
ncbi:S1 RNA-binding domain-containing protein [Streptomyces sp. UH6]|uniref:S1 RNA-binding domain-containing protein n=1 Tax=Streptomyces sp. UH6 TaxID=2748379 RepID=UPI0015D4AD85|nr:S1 RNA-binding domain-containing protein [Streptomyces sp. UH6]NYV73285.1 S1 RNA-binding domain-containing protein [Streptomyces sp. UH6]